MLQIIEVPPIDYLKKDIIENKKTRLSYISLLLHLNKHLSFYNKNLYRDSEILIKTLIYPEDILLNFLIYLMTDEYQCNLRNPQNKIASIAFSRILNDEDPQWFNLSNHYLKLRYWEKENEDSKKACKAASSAHCGYAYINPTHIIEASTHSCFNEKSLEFQSKQLFEILKYGE